MKNKNSEMALHPLLEAADDEPAVETTHPATAGAPADATVGATDRRQTIGIGFMGLGVVVLLIAWWGVSGTADTVDQLSYIGSGVAAGVCLLVVGTVLIVACEHTRDREAILQLGRELGTQLRQLEEGLAGEFDHLDRTLRTEKLRRA